jgi:hypothetical protein
VDERSCHVRVALAHQRRGTSGLGDEGAASSPDFLGLGAVGGADVAARRSRRGAAAMSVLELVEPAGDERDPELALGT